MTAEHGTIERDIDRALFVLAHRDRHDELTVWLAEAVDRLFARLRECEARDGG